MNETLQTLYNRRSPKSFRPEHVDKDTIEMIVKAGLKAPSGVNAQTPLFIVVTNDEMVAKLSKLNSSVGNMPGDPFHGAKDVIVVLARKECAYHYDGPLAIGNMLNAAYSLGVDSRWIHRCKEVFASKEGKTILQSLGINDEVEGIGFCILGYSDEPKVPKEIKPDRVFYVK